MKNSEEIKLDIIDTNENGFGIARHEGMVVFVPELLCGESAMVRITEYRKNYCIGACIERLTTSPERISEECPSAGSCGGCTLGYTTFENENFIKRGTVISALRRAGLGQTTVRDTVCAHERNAYRNKISVHYDASAHTFGYRRERSDEVIPFAGCLLCPDEMNEIVRFTNANTEHIKAMEPISLSLRSSLDGITVSLYVNHFRQKAFAEYKQLLLDKFPIIYDVLAFEEGKPAQDKQYIRDRIFGTDMNFTSEAFRQVNSAAFEKLLGLVHAFADEKPFACAADLYCGSGIIGLSLAKRFPDARFWGIEINRDAISDARHNAEANCNDNITFFAGDAATFRKRIPANERPELIIVDPPRAGLSKEMRSDLAELSPERIIYVSCNPQTMARDAAELCANGYGIREIVPVNMFPRTKHCECVCLLSKP